MRSLRPDEVQAVLHDLRREPPEPIIRKIAGDASWLEVELDGIEDLGSLRTLWHKRGYGLTKPEDASAPTVAEIAGQIHNRSFRRPGLQAKVTRYLNRTRSRQMEVKLVLEARSWGTFIAEGTTRAVALYLLHLRGENPSDLFPLKAVVFTLREIGSE